MAKLENKTKENLKLEQNKLSDGRISLYLEYYLGREEKPVLDENGNQVYYESGKMQGRPKFAIKHHRRKENLSLYLIDKPRTPAERQQNKETLELAMRIRAEREQEFKESMLGYRLKKDRAVNFEGTEKVSLQLFKELNLHIACILFGYVQIFCTLMP